MNRIIAIVAIVLGGLAIVLGSAGAAFAHYPGVTGSPVCTDGGWAVEWTAIPDKPRPNLTWSIGQTDGPRPGDEAHTFTTTHTHEQSSATVTVTGVWSNGASGTRSATTERPTACTATTTTTTTVLSPSTTSPTTTTVPATISPSTTSAPTTTAPETTTSTSSPTTSSPTTTSIVPDTTSTTTTSPDSTTTTEPPQSTSTTPTETSTTTPPTTLIPPASKPEPTPTTTPRDGCILPDGTILTEYVLVYDGPHQGTTIRHIMACDPLPPEASSPPEQPSSSGTEEDPAPELPATGQNLNLTLAAGALLATGSILARTARRKPQIG